MKSIYILISLGLMTMLHGCALHEPEITANDADFPYRLEFDETEGGDLADAEDFGIEIKFADYLGDLPTSAIELSFVLQGEGDFANVSVDEVLYVYEEDDCEFEREITVSGNTLILPVDPDLGTVPEEFEVVIAFNLPADEATDGGFTFQITGISGAEGVLFNTADTFEYALLGHAAAGAWELEFSTEAEFLAFQETFGLLSADLAELSFTDITGSMAVEFDFAEVKFEIELVETEEVESCEDGEVAVETENLMVEIEAEYDLDDEDFVIEFEGDYFNEDAEELGFIAEARYSIDEVTGQLVLEFTKIIGEDNYEEGDELFVGSLTLTLTED